MSKSWRGSSQRSVSPGSLIRGNRKGGESISDANDDEWAAARKRFQDIEERRLKEWENYQRSHRSSIDKKPHAFMDINIGDVPAGRLVIELFEDTVPLTVENFRALLMGTTPWEWDVPSPKLDYVDTTVSRIDRNGKFLLMGEFRGASIPAAATVSGEGAAATTMNSMQSAADSTMSTGPASLFRDENFAHRHSERGILSMAARGPNTVGSAFTITTEPAPSLDYKQVVFGKIVDGLQVLEKMEAVATTPKTGIPLTSITVVFCGALTGPKPPGVFEFKKKTDAKTGADSVETMELASAVQGEGEDSPNVGAPEEGEEGDTVANNNEEESTEETTVTREADDSTTPPPEVVVDQPTADAEEL